MELKYKVNGPGSYMNLLELLNARFTQLPTKVAVICGDEQLTYRELNQRVNLLASYLIHMGVQPGMLVGICVTRSVEMAVAILGVIKARGAYVPLDPSYPVDRLGFILQDAQAHFVVTQSEYLNLFAGLDIKMVLLDREKKNIEECSVSGIEATVKPESLAYVIYTSGSTGKPKGVMITHSSLINFIEIASAALDITSDDVYLQSASIAYALSVRQLMIPLAIGATVVVATSGEVADPLTLFKLIKVRSITLMDVVPSFWRSCIQRLSGLTAEERRDLLVNSLRRIVSIGEALMSDLPRDWQFQLGHKASLVNIFGQTETTGVVATYPIIPDPQTPIGVVPIGRSVPRTKIYILDSNLHLLPVGEVGELCVSNPCLALGYLNQPDLTAEKFVLNPFSDGLSERLYRTGDMARYRPDGNIEFLGRGDFQVKIRGQRLELGEVESVLREHEAVRDCVVVIRESGPDEKYLAAYVVPDQKKSMNPTGLKDFMRSRVPDHMVPSFFILLDSLPVTPNGKIDRLVLSDPVFIDSKLQQSETSAIDSLGETRERIEGFVPAKSDVERKLVDIWKSLFKLDSIGVYDDFFDLGGHSLLAVRMFTQIEQELGLRLSIAVILQVRTIAGLAEFINLSKSSSEAHVLIPIQPNGHRPPFYCVHGVGGSVLGYRDLVDALGNDQPFYGLQAPGLDDQNIIDLSIEEMAARYVDALRSFQPRGPYQIGGYCFGGVVAYEMACQLEEQSEEVSLLAVFEGYIPGIADTRAGFAKRLKVFWKSIPVWASDYASMDTDELRRRLLSTRNKVFSIFSHKSTATIFVPVEEILETNIAEVPDRNIELTRVHSLAFHQYKPKTYHGTVSLFRARNRSINEVMFGSLDPKMGWGKLAGGGVNVKIVDGFHRNIHIFPFVNSLASALRDCLDFHNTEQLTQG